jgi:hypothetical protein
MLNPALGPKSSICEGCWVDLVPKTGGDHAATVDSFTVSKPDRTKVRRRDPVVKASDVPDWTYEQLRQAFTAPSKFLRDGNAGIDLANLREATHIPEGVCTCFGKLVPDTWHSHAKRTPGREIEKAFARGTRTSLDKNFHADDAAELNSDGDDIAPFEPTESMTMQPGVEELREIVILSRHGGPARSYVEREQPHYRLEDAQMLPPAFRDKRFGIKSRIDFYVTAEVLRSMDEFDQWRPDVQDEPKESRDERLAAFVRETWADKEFVSPRTEDAPKSHVMMASDDKAVTRRLRKTRPKQIRKTRELLQTQRIYQSA